MTKAIDSPFFILHLSFQIVRGLLNTDDVTLSSKSSDIKSLNAQVKWLNQAKTTMSCFKDDEN